MKKINLLLPSLALTLGVFAFASQQSKSSVSYADSITYFDKVIKDSSDMEGWELVDMAVGNSCESFVGIYPQSDKTFGTATYLVTATSGNYLDTLQFGVYGEEGISRFAYYFGDFGAKAEISISTDNVDYVIAGAKEATGNAITSFDIDLSDSISGKKYTSLYVRLYLGTTTEGCGYDTSWTTLSGISIKGSEIPTDGERTEHEYTIGDFFGGSGTHGTSTPYSCNATEISGLCGDGNEVYGAIVGDTWGASIETVENQSGYVTYKIGKPGQVITSANINGVFSFSAKGQDDSFNGDRIFISISKDNINYENVVKYAHNNEAGYISYNSEDKLNVNLSLSDYLTDNNREQFLYVKFELTHLLALSSRELALIGMCLHNSSVTYETKNCLTIEYNPNGGELPTDAKCAFLEEDNEYTLPALTRDGYKFLGWFDKNDTQVTSFDPSIGESISVTAKWEINAGTYSITYVDPLNANNPNPETFSESSPVTLSNLASQGYSFAGWFDSETEGNLVTIVSTDTYSENVTLYARWVENEYPINYVLSDNVQLVVDGSESLPTSIKYSELIDYQVTLLNNDVLKYVKVNGQFITLFEGGFAVRGNTMDKIDIEVATDSMKHSLHNALEENFGEYAYGDHSYLENVYYSENARIIHDSNNNAGISISSGSSATLIYKFQANEKTHFDEIEISGSARLFDFNANPTNLQIYTSADGDSYKLLKQYVATNITSGDEYVDLSYDKVINDAKTIYVKAVLTGAANMDWAVIRALSINLNEIDDPKLAPTTTTTDTLSFDKYEPNDIQMNASLNGEELTNIKIDSSVLTTSEYSYENETLVIFKNTLASLSNGNHTITLTTAGGSVSWTVAVTDTTPSGDDDPDDDPVIDPEEPKKGCGGSIIVASSLVTLFSVLGLSLVISKRLTIKKQ